mgnify:FL=1
MEMNKREYPCEFCDTELPQQPKHVTVTRTRNGKWYIFDNVLAHVCPNCGHRYFDAEVLAMMEAKMKDSPDNARAVEAWAITLPNKSSI